jgi:hypothetical protein
MEPLGLSITLSDPEETGFLRCLKPPKVALNSAISYQQGRQRQSQLQRLIESNY